MLCLAVWDALSVLALSPLIALGVVSHGSGGRTGGLVARAHRLLLAGGVVVRPALGALGHEVAADATRRILVRALGVGPQLAILITALVVGVRYGQLILTALSVTKICHNEQASLLFANFFSCVLW